MKRFRNIAKSKGYFMYERPFELNIWGVRSRNTVPNRFDDELHVFFASKMGKIKRWQHLVFPCTTDPGTYWLNNPMNPQGTALLAPGQYQDAYRIDLHRGKYYALCQRLGKVKVIRDYNRNGILDFSIGNEEWGKFGINIHRARKVGTTFKVDHFSAGCQVFQRAEDFSLFMRLCEQHRNLYGNIFTYTLIDKRMEFRSRVKRTAIMTGILAGGAAVYYGLSQEQAA